MFSTDTDVIFYKQKIVALKTDGEVVIIDATPEFKVEQILEPPDLFRPTQKLYLVESNDDLLILSRELYLKEYVFRTSGFLVYKLDLTRNSSGSINAEWYEVKSLGDWILFPGLCPSSSFTIHDFPRCKGNCIYFTDDNLNGHLDVARKGFGVS
ncbi:F-box protein At2g26160-like [Macadamia integrifolia]|uniref:F-box protein At2g26160-like n=1 Tax=Macadamia integrifolia TaxID=60698 RepID=UPI001C4F975B|nr:F-box protein At2g26160-like [Macadamia integrifolia]